MHISDGVLSAPVILTGWVITLGFIIVTFKLKMQESDILEEIPKFSVMTAAFFVASLIHLPMGPTSVHPIFNGLIGVVLGPLAYISLAVGLTLQAFLFQHGGITTIGINTVLVGIPALMAYYTFKFGTQKGITVKILGAGCGVLAIIVTTILLVITLITTGKEFLGVAQVTAAAHIPLMVIEGLLTGTVVTYIAKVKPELLPVKLKNK